MKRTYLMMLMAAFLGNTAFAQRIETRKADRTKIMRLETAPNHLSVIELAEDVTQVAVGSSAYKVEWRENRVFVQPLEPNSRTNLFIWTRSGRLSYELVPASVESMHFAIDEEPAVTEKVKATPAPTAEMESVPPEMLLRSKPVNLMGTPSRAKAVEVLLTDVYRANGKIYLRYTLRNHGNILYRAAVPAVYRLAAARTSQSLVPVRDSQLVGEPLARLSSDAELKTTVLYADSGAQDLEPGGSSTGLVAFEEPEAEAGSRHVVKLEFPRRNAEPVVAYLVL